VVVRPARGEFTVANEYCYNRSGAVRWIVSHLLRYKPSLAGALSWTFNVLRQWHTARIVSDVVLRLRLDAFAAVVARDMSFYGHLA
jgi:hypothetical protein